MGSIFCWKRYSDCETIRKNTLDRKNQILLIVIGFILLALVGFSTGIALGVSSAASSLPSVHLATPSL